MSITPEELSKKLRAITIRTRRDAGGMTVGEYRSAFRGAGIEFDEVREYQPGDEVRSIDWNVTARQGRPFIKRFHEERQLTIFFAVDISASGRYGNGEISRAELAAELCATMALAAVRSNDKVGLMLFTDRVELFIPPAKGATHAMRIVREVLGFQPQGRGTDLPQAMEYLGRVLGKQTVLFLISDFIDAGDFRRPMQLLARRHDLIAIMLDDTATRQLPPVGLVELQDAESGQRMLVDCSNPKVQQYYAQYRREYSERMLRQLRQYGADPLLLSTGEDYTIAVNAFMRRREKHRR